MRGGPRREHAPRGDPHEDRPAADPASDLHRLRRVPEPLARLGLPERLGRPPVTGKAREVGIRPELPREPLGERGRLPVGGREAVEVDDRVVGPARRPGMGPEDAFLGPGNDVRIAGLGCLEEEVELGGRVGEPGSGHLRVDARSRAGDEGDP